MNRYRCVVRKGLCGIEDTMAIRVRVFHDEQGFTEVIDETDPVAHNIVLYDGERPVATGRVFPCRDGVYKIGRVAVEQEYRRGGTGRELMAQLEALARSLGAQAIQLSAQEGAVGFYERLGYAAFGEWYMDEHCPHRDMKKTL